VLAAVPAAGEIWRYCCCCAAEVARWMPARSPASDALVEWASWVGTAMSVAVGAYLLVWVLRGVPRPPPEAVRVRPSRSRRTVLIGWLVRVLNISMPGSVLAEVEPHRARPPAPVTGSASGLLRLWWRCGQPAVTLSLSPCCGRCAPALQDRANGVELHAVVDLLACGHRAVTARVVAWLTALVGRPRPSAAPGGQRA